MAFDTYLIDSLHKYIQANSTLLVLAATSLGHALIVRYVPLFGRTVAALALLNAVAMALIFAYDAVSIYVFGALAYLLTLLISRSTKNGSSKRWDLSIASLTLFVGWFLAQSIWRPSAPMTETPQSESAFRLVLDMLLLLRMVLFLWEYGAGRYEVPSIVEFFAWAGLPYSSQGTFLRFSDFHKQIKLGLKQHCPIGREWWIDLLSRIWLFVAGFLLTVLAKICESKGGIYKIVILYFTSPLGWYCIAAAQAGLMKLFGTLSGFDIPPKLPFAIRKSEFVRVLDSLEYHGNERVPRHDIL